MRAVSVVGALVGAVLGPPAVGSLIDASPSFLYWSVLVVVVVQTACFGAVAMMPRYAIAQSDDALGESRHASSSVDGRMSCSTRTSLEARACELSASTATDAVASAAHHDARAQHSESR